MMNDESRDKFIHDVHTASHDKFVLSEWESDKMAELVKYQSLENARTEGINEGISQGIEQGKEETLINTIKSMLKKNISIEDISDITNKSIEDIKKIKNTIED